MKPLHRIGRAGISILVCAGAIAFSEPARAGNGPQYFDYQVLLPQPPTDSGGAIASVDNREQAVLASVACGDMLQFAADSAKHEASEDSAARIMAKIEWGAGHQDSQGQKRISDFCRFSETIGWGDLDNQDICTLMRGAAMCTGQPAYDSAADALWAQIVGSFSSDPLGPLKKQVLEPVLGQGCATERGVTLGDAVADYRLLDSPIATDPRSGAMQIDFAVSQPCLLIEAAQALSALKIPVNNNGQQQKAGTGGAPCYLFGLFGTVNGNWDMAERNLIRIAYLIRKYGLAASPLFRAANTNLRNNLLTLDRGVETDSPNAFFGCGYSEGHTGSATDRATQRSDSGKKIGDALGDVLRFLALLAALLLAVGAVAALAGITLGDVLAAVAAAGVVAAILIKIPETENHLLTLYTSKYLNNQLIIEDLSFDVNLSAPYVDDQAGIKNWLLQRTHGLLEQDFIEYNSHPYQRDSIESIRNLFDFADDPINFLVPDPDLRNAAQLVLDYTAAKFAIGSSQGRRIVPYRRHRSDLAQTIDADATGSNGIFDLASGTDHQVGLGLLYFGQTQQLPLGQASRAFAEEIINAATSNYIPEPTTFDLAIVRNVPIYQRIHHATEEIYSSEPGFLISGGGLATGLSPIL
jgi:hypothetical protein